MEQEKRRADNAVKMLENFKSIQLKNEEGNDTLKNQMVRRMEAEEKLRKVEQRNVKQNLFRSFLRRESRDI